MTEKLFRRRPGLARLALALAIGGYVLELVDLVHGYVLHMAPGADPRAPLPTAPAPSADDDPDRYWQHIGGPAPVSTVDG